MTPDIIALTCDGAAGWASGNQLWNGTNPVFVPKPTKANINTILESVLFCSSIVLNSEKSKLPDFIDNRAKAIIINKTETCIKTKYFMPALITSFLLLSNITKKNELNDMISQQNKNINAFWQVTTKSIEAISIGKKIKWELKFFEFIYGLR